MKTEDPASKKRLFVGTFLAASDKCALAAWQSYDERLSTAFQGKLRWVAQQKLHLTWLFLGSVDVANIAEIENRLASVVSRHNSFSIDYTKMRILPSPSAPRHLILTADTIPPEAVKLAGDVKAALSEFIERPESRPYMPHITLLRFAQGSGGIQLPDWFPPANSLPVRHSIEQVELIESKLGSGAEGYQSLGSLRLR